MHLHKAIAILCSCLSSVEALHHTVDHLVIISNTTNLIFAIFDVRFYSPSTLSLNWHAFYIYYTAWHGTDMKQQCYFLLVPVQP